MIRVSSKTRHACGEGVRGERRAQIVGRAGSATPDASIAGRHCEGLREKPRHTVFLPLASWIVDLVQPCPPEVKYNDRVRWDLCGVDFQVCGAVVKPDMPREEGAHPETREALRPSQACRPKL